MDLLTGYGSGSDDKNEQNESNNQIKEIIEDLPIIKPTLTEKQRKELLFSQIEEEEGFGDSTSGTAPSAPTSIFSSLPPPKSSTTTEKKGTLFSSLPAPKTSKKEEKDTSSSGIFTTTTKETAEGKKQILFTVPVNLKTEKRKEIDDDDDDEKRPFKKSGTESAGALSFLPAPKNEKAQLTQDIIPQSVKNRTTIPEPIKIVPKQQPQTTTETTPSENQPTQSTPEPDDEVSRQKKAKLQQQNEQLKQKSQTGQAFFRQLLQNKVTTPVAKPVAPPKAPVPEVSDAPPSPPTIQPTYGSDYSYGYAPVAAPAAYPPVAAPTGYPPVADPYYGGQQYGYGNQQMQNPNYVDTTNVDPSFIPSRELKEFKQGNFKMMDVNMQDIRKDWGPRFHQEPLIQPMPGPSANPKAMPDRSARRQGHISFLQWDMNQKVGDLEVKRAQSRQVKKESASKYGW